MVIPMKRLRTLMMIVTAAVTVAAVPAMAGAPEERALAAIDRSGYAVEERAALRQDASRALRAGVPAEDLEVIVMRGRERGAPAAAVRGLIDAAAVAGERNLPLRPVLDRIEQGLAKGVPPERIAAAAQQLAGHLAAAGPIVDSLEKQGLRTTSARERSDALEGVARARERSVPDDVIRRIGGQAGERGRTMAQFDRAVQSLAFLTASGMTVDAAERVTAESVERGFTEKDYARLERSVHETLAKGGTMNDAVSAAEREITENRRDTRERGPGGGRESGSRGGRGR
jgi:hypothetical protein